MQAGTVFSLVQNNQPVEGCTIPDSCFQGNRQRPCFSRWLRERPSALRVILRDGFIWALQESWYFRIRRSSAR